MPRIKIVEVDKHPELEKKRGRPKKINEESEVKKEVKTEVKTEVKKEVQKSKEIKQEKTSLLPKRGRPKTKIFKKLDTEQKEHKEQKEKEKISKPEQKRGRPKTIKLAEIDTENKEIKQVSITQKNKINSENQKEQLSITPKIKNDVWKTYTSKQSSQAELKNIFLGEKPTESYIRIKEKLKKELDKKTII